MVGSSHSGGQQQRWSAVVLGCSSRGQQWRCWAAVAVGSSRCLQQPGMYVHMHHCMCLQLLDMNMIISHAPACMCSAQLMQCRSRSVHVALACYLYGAQLHHTTRDRQTLLTGDMIHSGILQASITPDLCMAQEGQEWIHRVSTLWYTCSPPGVTL